MIALANPRRIKASHRRRGKVASAHRLYILNNPLAGTDPTGYMFDDGCNRRQSCQMRLNPLNTLKGEAQAALSGALDSSVAKSIFAVSKGNGARSRTGNVSVRIDSVLAAAGRENTSGAGGSTNGEDASSWTPKKLALTGGTSVSSLTGEQLTAIQALDHELDGLGSLVDQRLAQELAIQDPNEARIGQLKQLQYNLTVMSFTFTLAEKAGKDDDYATAGFSNASGKTVRGGDGVFRGFDSVAMNFYPNIVSLYKEGATEVRRPSGTMIRQSADYGSLPAGSEGLRRIIFHESGHTLPQIQMDFSRNPAREWNRNRKEDNAESWRRFLERK